MEWDPELLAKLRGRGSRKSTEVRELRELRKEVSLRRKHRKASSLSANQATTSQIKMIVGQWYTDELGNRARMIYNAKTVDLPRLTICRVVFRRRDLKAAGAAAIGRLFARSATRLGAGWRGRAWRQDIQHLRVRGDARHTCPIPSLTSR